MTMRRSFVVALALVSGWLLFACAQGAPGAGKEARLDDAIRARTEVTVLMQEMAELPRDVRRPMRKLIAKGEAQQMAGNILLTKDKYAEAVKAYGLAAAFYRQALDGRKILKRLAEAHRKVDRARMLAEASGAGEKLRKVRALEINADGYEQAAAFERAIAELERARKAYEALLAPGKATTLEEAVAARTAMIATRKQVRDLPQRDRAALRRLLAEKPGETRPLAVRPEGESLSDLLGRATRAELAAAEALEEREYTPARALFAHADDLYRLAATLQKKRDRVLAARKTARDSMKLADSAFKTEARTASFERGKQSLADGDKALGEEDLDKAKRLFAAAVEFFAKAQGEAELANELAKAQDAWAGTVAAADEELLRKHVSREWAAAMNKAAEAEKKAQAGRTEAATALFKEATAALKNAAAQALTLENTAKAAPIVARLEDAVARKKKFVAEDILAELETLIPSDRRMPGLRKKVAAVPGPKKRLVVSLGTGVNMEFILIRPGSFTMGSNDGDDDEKPVHKVTITRPFYIGKYEVTQEQWQAVMGTNPSSFKGPRNPVENVSWNGCRDFLTKLREKAPGRSFRLPTEAEWEYACRAGSTTKFHFGDDEGALSEYAWYTGNSGSKTHPVGTKKPNAFGLYDMHGNVQEWCQDWHAKDYYLLSPSEDPQGPATVGSRVLRGGSWSYLARLCRSANRFWFHPLPFSASSTSGFGLCARRGRSSLYPFGGAGGLPPARFKKLT